MNTNHRHFSGIESGMTKVALPLAFAAAGAAASRNVGQAFILGIGGFLVGVAVEEILTDVVAPNCPVCADVFRQAILRP